MEARLFFCSQCDMLLRDIKEIHEHVKASLHQNIHISIDEAFNFLCNSCNQSFANLIEVDAHSDDFGHKEFRSSTSTKITRELSYSTPPAIAQLDHSEPVPPVVKKAGKMKGPPYAPRELHFPDDDNDFKNLYGKTPVITDGEINLDEERASRGGLSKARNLINTGLTASTIASLKTKYIIAEHLSRDEALEKVNEALSGSDIDNKVFEFRLPTKGDKACIYDKELKQICLKKKKCYLCAAKKAKQIGEVLLIMKGLLEQDKYFRVRTIYYTHPELFGLEKNEEDMENKEQDKEISQLDVLYKTIGEISCMLEITRESLHLRGSPHGIVKGPAQLYVDDILLVDCSLGGASGNLIPDESETITHIHPMAEIKFILVVEKDTVFHYLADNNFPEEEGCILISGKGQADIYTRMLIRKFNDCMSWIPVYGLTDANPGGASIFSTFCFGSEERAYDNLFLSVPGMMYIGLFMLDIEVEFRKALTESDKRRINNMLEKGYVDMIPSFRRNLQVMIDNGQKADIDMLMKEHKIEIYIKEKIDELKKLPAVQSEIDACKNLSEQMKAASLT